MKKSSIRKSIHDQGKMLSEYNLRGLKGVRGKYYRAMRDGYTITIHKKDGTTVVKEVKPKGTILLEPDVQAHFPDSVSVNSALRSLIPAKHTTAVREARSTYTTRRVTRMQKAETK